MNKRADLFREYARVIEMCEGTKVRPYECVRSSGGVCQGPHEFAILSPDSFTFAIAIVEDRPVFEDDELYSLMSGEKVRAVRHTIPIRIGEAHVAGPKAHLYSWNPPKPKTITLTDMPKPRQVAVGGGSIYLAFDSVADSEAWYRAISI